MNAKKRKQRMWNAIVCAVGIPLLIVLGLYIWMEFSLANREFDRVMQQR